MFVEYSARYKEDVVIVEFTINDEKYRAYYIDDDLDQSSYRLSFIKNSNDKYVMMKLSMSSGYVQSKKFEGMALEPDAKEYICSMIEIAETGFLIPSVILYDKKRVRD